MLHVVATPIGNLGDLTPRALEALKGASLIACEDTRRTWQLLSHFGVPRPEMVSYRQGNEERVSRTVIDAVNAGREVVLVSDGGYPRSPTPVTASCASARRRTCRSTSFPARAP